MADDKEFAICECARDIISIYLLIKIYPLDVIIVSFHVKLMNYVNEA